MRQEEKNVTDKSRKSEGRSKKVVANKVAAIMFLAVILIFVITDLIHKDQKFSENENRMLTQKPKVTQGGIADGRYMKQFESYKSDQFAGRDFWVGMKTKLDWLTGSREENGVLKCDDGYLMEDIALPEEDSLEENLEAMITFQEKHSDVQMNVLLVPDAAAVLKDKLPAFSDTADQKTMLKQVKNSLGDSFVWMDALKSLNEHKDDEIYYRTDHHWTTKGAHYVFQDTASLLGIEDDRIVKMQPYAVTDTFNGTLSSKSGYERSTEEPVYIYLPEDDTTEVVVNYTEEQKKTASMYDSSKLKEKDKYAVFFGGNHALTQIRTTSGSKDKLLVIKDSYANCFLPFLTYYYRDIVVVDPRYYYGNIEELMAEKEITQVLYLYNANTFFGDNNISGVLDIGETE